MKRPLSLALAATLIVPSLALAQAKPSTPGCVTLKEFVKAKPKMTKKRVHSIFGTKGKLYSITKASGIRIEIRNYRVCESTYGNVSVIFQNEKLEAKSYIA